MTDEWWVAETDRLLRLAELAEARIRVTPRWRWFRRYRLRNDWLVLAGALQQHEQLRTARGR